MVVVRTFVARAPDVRRGPERAICDADRRTRPGSIGRPRAERGAGGVGGDRPGGQGSLERLVGLEWRPRWRRERVRRAPDDGGAPRSSGLGADGGPVRRRRRARPDRQGRAGAPHRPPRDHRSRRRRGASPPGADGARKYDLRIHAGTGRPSWVPRRNDSCAPADGHSRPSPSPDPPRVAAMLPRTPRSRQRCSRARRTARSTPSSWTCSGRASRRSSRRCMSPRRRSSCRCATSSTSRRRSPARPATRPGCWRWPAGCIRRRPWAARRATSRWGSSRSTKSFDRGWYAGPVGWLGADGDGEMMVALRCGLVRGLAGDAVRGLRHRGRLRPRPRMGGVAAQASDDAAGARGRGARRRGARPEAPGREAPGRDGLGARDDEP